MTWSWIWPGTGPAPTSDEPDAEIFDTERVPLAHSFVREAVQNSLDAAAHDARVFMRFSFGSDTTGAAADIFSELKRFRIDSDQGWPDSETLSWISVEDFGTSGLKGGLSERTGDFWNYWLNFGITNKSGSGRGGRGVGRKTFLLISAIKTVIGFTRRDDGLVAVSGYAMLRPKIHDGRMRAGLAIFAAAENNDVYVLHPSDRISAAVANAFSVEDRASRKSNGFSLVVPFPSKELTPDKIKAALIENFAPAIMSGLLGIEVSGQRLNDLTIDAVAKQVANDFSDQSFRERYAEILNLLRKARDTPDREISVDNPGSQRSLKQIIGDAVAAELRTRLQENGLLVLKIFIPVNQGGVSEQCPVKVALSEAAHGKVPIDEFYRSGMRLPNVVSRSPGSIDVVILADEGNLVTYLNLCEGKAHLDLLENEEVKRKLLERAFVDGVAVRRRIKRLPDEVRDIVLPDAAKPDSSLFSKFFSAPPRSGDGKKPKAKKKKSKAPPDPPAPQPSILRAVKVDLGFEVRVDSSRAERLVGATVRIKASYANGSRKLDWHKMDFDFAKTPIAIEYASCDVIRQKGNEILCTNCGKDFFIRVVGFDPKRELETDVAILRPQSEDA